MLKVFKCNQDAIVPSYATARSACFDVHACLSQITGVKAKLRAALRHYEEDVLLKVDADQVRIPPGGRALIPTGLKFDIPENHSLRLHPRSGLSFKHGLNLSNCEGVIDEDYIEEVFVSVCNNSSTPIIIKHGDRICQGELVLDSRCAIDLTESPPTAKSNRSGGFGSTGT